MLAHGVGRDGMGGEDREGCQIFWRDRPGRRFEERYERHRLLPATVMAATARPLATEIAIETLKAGGGAVDAAIAANAALGLMEPVSNGIGGDLFAIVWDPKTKKLYGYNGSGRSPKSLTLEYLQQ